MIFSPTPTKRENPVGFSLLLRILSCFTAPASRPGGSASCGFVFPKCYWLGASLQAKSPKFAKSERKDFHPVFLEFFVRLSHKYPSTARVGICQEIPIAWASRSLKKPPSARWRTVPSRFQLRSQ